jgi:hypothetical protein
MTALYVVSLERISFCWNHRGRGAIVRERACEEFRACEGW